ncbi:hypothetical protein TorRG33x02_182730 [Trema orientale]|uniref:Uncharacterized protein n=1 Tax=Trema orientale TaxID=63057 RepID=A0A2P5EK47_TREOI|nr:hypothetical protein TorRG33x02_182730 [Trema orientale]
MSHWESFHIHEASFVHIFDMETKKALGDVNLLEAPPYLASSKPLVELVNTSLSSLNHHKPYNEKIKKWCDKKKNLESHFELGP